MLLRTALLLTFVGLAGYAKTQDTPHEYRHLERHDKNSKDLIENVRRNERAELKKLNWKTDYYRPHIEKSSKHIIREIKEGHYIKNDSLTQMIEEIASEFLQRSEINLQDPIFLIRADPTVNAQAHIINVFEFSVGMLWSVASRVELAFVVGHELAHQIKFHPANRVYEYHHQEIEDVHTAEFGKILKGRGTLEGLQKMQSVTYDLYKNSRENELEADSMAISLLLSSGYQAREALPVFAKLGYDVFSFSIPSQEILRQLFTADYPLQSRWLVQKLPIYNRMPGNIFIYNADSVMSHPDTEYRREVVEKRLDTKASEKNYDELLQSDYAFATLESAMICKKYDVALYLALNLRMHHPGNSYIVTTIGRIFLDLYQARYDRLPEHNFYQYVNHFTVGYPDDLTTINSFLNNLTKEEMLEIAFQFLNNTETFDRDEEDHYKLLYDISDKLSVESVTTEVAAAYRSNFPDGKYLKQLK